MADELGADDFKQLYGLLTSGSDSDRALGLSLTKKLTPAEESSFASFQKTQHAANPELHRADNTLGGLPPELAAIGTARVAVPMAQAGLSMAQRAGAGLSAAGEQVMPIAKAELVKSGLSALGVPRPIAEALAFGVAARSGAKTGKPIAAAENAAETAAKAKMGGLSYAPSTAAPSIAEAAGQRPLASYEIAINNAKAAEQATAPSIAATAATKSPQWALNNLAIQARRLGVTLTEDETKALQPLVQAGADPAAAIQAIKPPTDPAAALAAKLGTPSDADVQSAFNKRWQRGQIKDYAGRPK